MYQVNWFHYINSKFKSCELHYNFFLQIFLKQKYCNNKSQVCIRQQSENLYVYTLEESSMALCKFLSLRWQAARFKYSSGSLLFSRTARLYAFTAARQFPVANILLSIKQEVKRDFNKIMHHETNNYFLIRIKQKLWIQQVPFVVYNFF